MDLDTGMGVSAQTLNFLFLETGQASRPNELAQGRVP